MAKPKKRVNNIPSLSTLTQPNAGKPLSFNSGLHNIKPCRGARQNLQPIWRKAGKVFDIKWQILAAISKVESGFGCNMGPSSAGAEGWTQFIPSTWDRWGTDADGDGVADPSNAVDAVFATARYLRVGGAPADYHKAILSYNHAEWYVKLILDTANKFGNIGDTTYKQTAKDYAKAARLADRVAELRRQLQRLDFDILDARQSVKDNKKLIRESAPQLKKLQQQVIDREAERQRAQRRVDQLTLQYVQVTQGLSNSDNIPKSEDDRLVRYLASADSSDAVLVYEQAGALLDDSSRMLDQLKVASNKAEQLRLQSEAAVTEVQRVQNIRAEAIKKHTETIIQLTKDKTRAKTRVRSLNKSLTQYEQRFNAPLDSGPLGADSVDSSLPGLYRWPVSGQVTSPFCEKRSYESCHPGIDISVPEGTPLKASRAGVVSSTQSEAASGGYGKYVCIQHTPAIQTCYAHLSKIFVTEGQKLKQHEVLGLSGNTGHSTGPHLHFEVRKNDKVQNPFDYMP